MKNLNLFFVLAATAFLAASCMDASESEVDVEGLKSELQAMDTEFAEAVNANDVDSMLSYYADDAHSMPPGKPTLKGKDAIRADMEANDMDGGTIAFEVLDVWAAGDQAVATGAWTFTNDEGQFTGKYMSIYEKRDGEYVCIRDIWNSDQPMMDDEDEDMSEVEPAEPGEQLKKDQEAEDKEMDKPVSPEGDLQEN